MNTMPSWYASVRLPLLFLQAVVGMQLFAYPLARRRHFLPRAAGGLVAALFVAWLCSGFWQLRENSLPGIAGRVFSMMAVYFLLILFAWLCYEESFWTALFVASSGYIAQDIAGSLKTILRLLPPLCRPGRPPGGHPAG